MAFYDPRRLHAGQGEVYRSSARFRYVCCGRGWGKTHLAMAEVLRVVTTDPRARSGQRGFEVLYVGPTRNQVRAIAWEWLKSMIPEDWLVKGRFNETLMEAQLVWGPKIQLVGADKLRAQRGRSVNFAVLDEFAHMREGIWKAVRPTLRTRGDRALIITTPNGPNHAFELWNQVQQDQRWKVWTKPTWSWTGADKDNIEEAKETLSRVDFEQEYGANFAALSGAVYCDFSVDNVVPVELDRRLPLAIGQDFNARNYSTVFGQLHGDELWVVDEMLTSTTLQDHIAALQRKLVAMGYPDFRDVQRVTFYTDASGEYNRTSEKTPMSDGRLMRQAGFMCRGPQQNPAVLDRVRVVQGLIRNANGRRRLLVNPRCAELKRCLMNQVWTRWGKPDKVAGLDHFPDALGYLSWGLFPLKKGGYAEAA